MVILTCTGYAYQVINKWAEKIRNASVTQFKGPPLSHVFDRNVIMELIRHMNECVIKCDSLEKP